MKLEKYYASAMYEWWLALKQLKNAHENCEHCATAAEKLEKYIGIKEVRRLKRLVKKYPYNQSSVTED